MLQRQTYSASYWTDSFRVTNADIEHIFSIFLEEETPLSNRELALRVIAFRLKQEEDRLRRLIERGQLFQPKNKYAVGQELIFPAFDYTLGKVISERPGQNADYGDFSVIKIELEDKRQVEVAAGLSKPHALNIDAAGGSARPSPGSANAEEIFAQHGETIIDEIEARLVDEKDAVYMAGRWFVRTLLADVGVGDLHLAEAILDINEGGPLTAAALLNDVEVAKEAPQAVREFSLNVALSQDDRFDEVGPTGQVLWFLRRLEPPEVNKAPDRLAYQPTDYARDLLSNELHALEADLDDEFSDLPPPTKAAQEATLTLIYPHRRLGTLPLTSRVQALFPTALEAQRVRVTLVDGQTGAEFAGWIARERRYVFGLDSFYRTHKLPIGAYVTIKRTDDPAQLIIDFESHRPHTEYIRLAVPANNKLTFANFKRSIGAGYDELMILGAEDLEGVDAIWSTTGRDKRRNLFDIMRDLVPELAKLNPQNAVHAKTLYSAVNVIRRSPPGPIFAQLVARPEFEHVGGPYWRLSSS